MAHYLIGDLQGCDEPLARLLAELDFSPSRDTLYLLGDLVNRGPDSLAVLRRLQALGSSAHCLLGNHDLHLLAVAHGVRPAHKSDTVAPLLAAPDAAALLDWLRHRHMALHVQGWLLVHAGVLPQWSTEQVLALAQEVEALLRGPGLKEWLGVMYGNEPSRWSDSLQGPDRWRVVVNALTRLRFCSASGDMEFQTKDAAGEAPTGYLPWYAVPGRRTADTPVAFGHWSTLGLMQGHHVLSLDTGCVWGGCLSAARLDAAHPATAATEIIQVRCPQAQMPGQKPGQKAGQKTR
ncbi:MAG: symmetrical bis(5'-nucleosyl)-tetraphosphatase [Serpentinimonas sp.]|jgi:bis(5'-nucleosyl)-tetraphosphatase (symmetrical)|nr:symmetrical bis(5'-nucleosyl)-tetraphosphatase [Serpentinimonas sp.]